MAGAGSAGGWIGAWGTTAIAVDVLSSTRMVAALGGEPSEDADPHYGEYSPAWVVDSFFVPLLNLFRPYLAMREIWRLTSAFLLVEEGRPPQDPEPLPAIPLWWLSWLGAGFANLWPGETRPPTGP